MLRNVSLVEPATPRGLGGGVLRRECDRRAPPLTMTLPLVCRNHNALPPTTRTSAPQGVFSSAASDGTYAFWDKDKRSRTREAKIPPPGHAISASAFNPAGDLFAYTKSYDWSRGAEGFDLAKEPTRVLVHWTVDKDLRPPPAVKR